MLLQLSHFSFSSLFPSTLYPPPTNHSPHLSSCPWVKHIISLAFTFAIPGENPTWSLHPSHTPTHVHFFISFLYIVNVLLPRNSASIIRKLMACSLLFYWCPCLLFMLASSTWEVFPPLLFHGSFQGLGIYFSLNVWCNLPVKQPGPGYFLVYRLFHC